MHDDIDLTDLDRFAAGFPYHVFDELRRSSPVWFHPPTPAYRRRDLPVEQFGAFTVRDGP